MQLLMKRKRKSRQPQLRCSTPYPIVALHRSQLTNHPLHPLFFYPFFEQLQYESVAVLKMVCESLNLPTSGAKKVLIARIAAASLT